MLTCCKERWEGIRSVPETVDGFDWAPYRAVYRVWRYRGIAVWWRLLAWRYEDQYWIVRRMSQ